MRLAIHVGLLLVACLLLAAGCGAREQSLDRDAQEPTRDKQEPSGLQPGRESGPVNGAGNVTSKKHANEARNSTTPGPALQNAVEMDASSINTGALKRAIIVIFGLCGVVMVYMAFRSFRVHKSRPQMVRKYGILAHRQDVEMRPLPLDEDDEDDTTVFDASIISAQRLET